MNYVILSLFFVLPYSLLAMNDDIGIILSEEATPPLLESKPPRTISKSLSRKRTPRLRRNFFPALPYSTYNSSSPELVAQTQDAGQQSVFSISPYPPHSLRPLEVAPNQSTQNAVSLAYPLFLPIQDYTPTSCGPSEILPPPPKPPSVQLPPHPMPKSHQTNTRSIPQLPQYPDFSSHPYYTALDKTTLELTHNDLESLSPSIGELTILKKLLISHNSLAELPDETRHLTGLRLLEGNNNCLKTVPILLTLIRLTECQLSHNELIELPSLQPLTQLSFLDLSYNELSELPSLPPSVEEAYLTANNLRTLPSFPALSEIQILSLSDNQLESLPPGLAHLQKLKLLNLMNNPFDRHSDGRQASIAYILYRLAGKAALRAAKSVLKHQQNVLVKGLKSLTNEDLLLSERQSFDEMMAILSQNIPLIDSALEHAQDGSIQQLTDYLKLYQWLFALHHTKRLLLGNTFSAPFWDYTVNETHKTLPDEFKRLFQLLLEEELYNQVEL